MQLAPPPASAIAHDDFSRQAQEEREAILKCAQESSRLEALGLLTSGVSHDFNNLLTVLLGSLRLAKEDIADRPDTLSILRNAETAANRAQELCSRIGNYVRRGDGQQERFDLHALVHDAVGLMGVSRKDVSFEFQLGASSSEVFGIAVEMRRILMNLLVNATEAMGERGGHIALSSRTVLLTSESGHELPAGNYIELRVKDNGSGIPPAVLPHIFDPFFTTKKTGTGLGLSAVRPILRQHGGTIGVESTSDLGTTFIVLLPLIASAIRNEDARWGNSARVLVVDDDEVLRPLLASVLRSHGFIADEAADGRTALACFVASSEPYAAVMLDLTLPGGLDGADVLAGLREKGMHGGVVLISGLENTLVMRRINPAHYSSFLRKPFGSEDIMRAIRHALSRA